MFNIDKYKFWVNVFYLKKVYNKVSKWRFHRDLPLMKFVIYTYLSCSKL